MNDENGESGFFLKSNSQMMKFIKRYSIFPNQKFSLYYLEKYKTINFCTLLELLVFSFVFCTALFAIFIPLILNIGLFVHFSFMMSDIDLRLFAHLFASHILLKVVFILHVFLIALFGGVIIAASLLYGLKFLIEKLAHHFVKKDRKPKTKRKPGFLMTYIKAKKNKYCPSVTLID